jgi:hypothetical protein
MSTAIQVRWERGSKKRENWQITTGTAISARSYVILPEEGLLPLFDHLRPATVLNDKNPIDKFLHSFA